MFVCAVKNLEEVMDDTCFVDISDSVGLCDGFDDELEKVIIN